MLEESQRVQFDGHLGTPKGPLGAKLKVVTGPDGGVPRVPCDSGYGCLHLSVHVCKMDRLYLSLLPCKGCGEMKSYMKKCLGSKKSG